MGRFVSCSLAMFALMAPSTLARADGTVRKEISFLGFTEDGSRFLLHVRDAHTGDLLSLRSVDTGKAERTIPVDQPAALEKAIAKARAELRIRDAGVEGPISPDGRHTVILVPKGPKTQVRVLRGERQAVLKTLEGRDGPQGTVRWTLRSVHWSSNGRSLVLLLHRQDSGPMSEDTDQAVPLRFVPSELNFGATP